MVEGLANSVWQDLLGVGIIALIFTVLYMRMKHKSFKEVWENVKVVFQ